MEALDFEFKNVIHIFVELFHMSRKNIGPSSKILCELQFCVCDYGTYAGDNLNCSYGCSSSRLLSFFFLEVSSISEGFLALNRIRKVKKN